MSEPEQIKQGVYRKEGQIIVVLPSDKVLVELIATQPQSPQSEAIPIQSTPLADTNTENKEEPAWYDLSTLTATHHEIVNHWHSFSQCWKEFDKKAATEMTEFKKEYVLPVGDLPVRTVCMAVSTGLIYALFGRLSRGVVSRTRNLVGSFVVSGLFWLPESFNPYLFRHPRI